MTPADEIRQAAATLRETAKRAVHEMRSGAYWDHNPSTFAEGIRNACGGHAGDLAALMTPLLANILAAQLESWDGFEVPESTPHSDDWEHALKVSRAINGREDR